MSNLEGLTKEERRTVEYWSHCIREVAKSHNIDLQYFIDNLKEESDNENRN